MSFRGKGSRVKARGSWKDGKGSRKLSVLPTPAPPLGEILATLQLDDLEDGVTEVHDSAQITNARYLTSYNWINGASPQIIVPGEKSYPGTQNYALPPTNIFLQVSLHNGLLYLSQLPFEGTPVFTIETKMRHVIPDTRWSQ